MGGNPISFADPLGLMKAGGKTAGQPAKVSADKCDPSESTIQAGLSGQAGGWILGGILEGGFAVPGNVDDLCVYAQFCSVLGPQWVAAGGFSGGIGQGAPSTGISESQGGTWFGGTGAVGNGQVTVNKNGQLQGSRGMVRGGAGAGAGAGYVNCTQAMACIRR